MPLRVKKLPMVHWNSQISKRVFPRIAAKEVSIKIFCYGTTKQMEDIYTDLFGCNTGEYLFRYLGIPMQHRQLLNSEWSKIEEHFEKKLSCWKAKYLSYGGRLVLLNSVLSSLPMFMMSFFEIPKGVLKNLDQFRSRFFWQGSSDKHKLRLAKWDILCRPKEQGGGTWDLKFTVAE